MFEYRSGPLRRPVVLAIVASALAVGLASDRTAAFKIPIHKDITRGVLPGLGFNAAAVERIVTENANTDINDFFTSTAHFDNTEFTASAARLRQKIEDIKVALLDCDVAAAHLALGRALHATQDFYSHSSFVNLHVAGLVAQPFDLTVLTDPGAASSCSPLPSGALAIVGLSSGFYALVGDVAPAGRCRHGNALLADSDPNQLNKDYPGSLRGAEVLAGTTGHVRARTLATTATTDFIAQLEASIRADARFGAVGTGLTADDAIRLLKTGSGVSYFFVLDDTGSMSEELAGVKANVVSIANRAETTGICLFHLYTFKDSVTFHGTFGNATDLGNAVNPLFPSGGGDCPEAAGAALLAAVSKARKGDKVYLATDATAGDPGSLVAAYYVANSTGISVDVILTGDCDTTEPFGLTGAPRRVSGDAGQTQAVGFGPEDFHYPAPVRTTGPRVRQAGEEAVADVSDLNSSSARVAFRALSILTGGTFVQSTKEEFEANSEIVLTQLNAQDVKLAIIVGTVAPEETVSYQVAVDPSLEAIFFDLTTVSATGLAHTVERPDGSVVAEADGDATVIGTSSVGSVQITAPAPGTWRVAVTGDGVFQIIIHGPSPVAMRSFDFIEGVTPPLSHSPDPVFRSLPGQPVAGETAAVQTLIDEEIQDPSFTLRTLDGTTIQTLSLTDTPRDDMGEGTYYGEFTVPDVDFLVYVKGEDASGNALQRALTERFKGESVSVETITPASAAAPGDTLEHQFRIRNTGPAATFDVTGSSSKGFAVTLDQTAVTLDTGASVTVTATIEVPLGSASIGQDTLIVQAVHQELPSVQNSSTVVTQIPGEPVADAGIDQVVVVGTTVTLDASGSSDPADGALQYLWEQQSGPTVTLGDSTSPITTFEGTERSIYVFALTATNAEELVSVDAVQITVQHPDEQPPVANAGADQTVATGATVVLDASGSSDLNGDPLTYSWSQLDGEPVELSAVDIAQPTFVAPADGQVLTFALLVNDMISIAGDEVTITVGLQQDGGGGAGGAGGSGCGGGGGMCGAGMIWVLPVLLLSLGRIRSASARRRK